MVAMKRLEKTKSMAWRDANNKSFKRAIGSGVQQCERETMCLVHLTKTLWRNKRTKRNENEKEMEKNVQQFFF